MPNTQSYAASHFKCKVCVVPTRECAARQYVRLTRGLAKGSGVSPQMQARHGAPIGSPTGSPTRSDCPVTLKLVASYVVVPVHE